MNKINKGARTGRKVEATETKRPIASWTGFVALLDILGFRAIVSSPDFEEKAKRYSAILERSTDAYPRLGYLTFSDTIVIYSDRSAALSNQVLEDLLNVVGDVCFRCLQELEWPLRGCVTSGPLTRMQASSGMIVAGRAIVDAYHYETRQDWVGTMVSPSLIASYPDALDHLEQNVCIYPYSRIPLRDDGGLVGGFDGCVVIPKVALPEGEDPVRNARDSTIAYGNQLHRLSMYAPDVSAQQKYERSRRWIDSKKLENWFRTLESLRKAETKGTHAAEE